MRRSAVRPKQTYATVGDIQRGGHYATHADQPIQHRPMILVDDLTMNAMLHACDPATARGVPEYVNYAEGVIRVWPWPAEGWQVWSEVSGKDVTP